MVRRRGITLVGTLWTLALLGILLSATLGGISMLRARLQRHKDLQQASALAVSGQDYARAQLRRHRWRPPHHFQSPELPGGGHFEVEVSAGKIRSTGYYARARQQLEAAP
ncbi:MAG: type II secretion system protein [Candidatus Eremiobacteraeota bacterium]|nr:type II secretion system protein [Candidatus Eremiobacteraeota bacterium]MCW5869664.1 type II secretion system protein [Candidatus Eremiobacteraeota bacterium]